MAQWMAQWMGWRNGWRNDRAEAFISEFYLSLVSSRISIMRMRHREPYFFSTNAYISETYWETPRRRMRRAHREKIMFYESEEFYRNLIAQVKGHAIFAT